MAFLIVHLGFEAVEVTLSFIVLSLLLYFLYGKRQMKREFALLHIVERMTDKRLTDSVLESELVEIVFTRDELVKDRVDAVFRGLPVSILAPVPIERPCFPLPQSILRRKASEVRRSLRLCLRIERRQVLPFFLLLLPFPTWYAAKRGDSAFWPYAVPKALPSTKFIRR